MTEYVQHPETARTYNGLQDYRVMWAESTPSILLALEDPRSEAGQVCRVLALEDDAALEHAMTHRPPALRRVLSGLWRCMQSAICICLWGQTSPWTCLAAPGTAIWKN